MIKIKIKKSILWLLIILSLGYALISSHILTPTKFENLQNKTLQYFEDAPIKIEKEKELSRECYIGKIDDRLQNKEIYIGTLNYLCKTFHEKNIPIRIQKGFNINENRVLAQTSGIFGIILFYNNLNEYYQLTQNSLEHIIFHEYIHLLMFRHMSNIFTIDYKSQELLDFVKSKYKNLPEYIYKPTDYSSTLPREQIAEILGLYLAKRANSNESTKILVTNFEKDLYKQLLLNIQ